MTVRIRLFVSFPNISVQVLNGWKTNKRLLLQKICWQKKKIKTKKHTTLKGQPKKSAVLFSYPKHRKERYFMKNIDEQIAKTQAQINQLNNKKKRLISEQKQAERK